MVIYNLLLLHCLFIIIIIYQLLLHTVYAVAGNFRGAKFSWFSWLEVWPRIFYPQMKRPCLPLPTIQAATTKILSMKCLNIAEPRIFCPPKITRYTVAYYLLLLLLLYQSTHGVGYTLSKCLCLDDTCHSITKKYVFKKYLFNFAINLQQAHGLLCPAHTFMNLISELPPDPGNQ